MIPEVKGKIDGIAMRVPTPDVSLTDLTVRGRACHDRRRGERGLPQRPPPGALEGVLGYSEEPLVSTDYIGNPHSCTLDAMSTNVIDGTLVKVPAGTTTSGATRSRCVDLLRFVGARLGA